MVNFDLEALQKALAQQQGSGMGLPPMGGGPLAGAMAQQQPQIPVPEPDIFPAQQPVAKSPLQQFAEPQQQPANLNPAAPTPKSPAPALPQAPEANAPDSAYEQRIAQLMEERGWDRQKAEGNQNYAISQGYDLNGDGIVTDAEFGSGYTSTANPAVANQYKNTGKGNGSIYFDATQREDSNGMSQMQGFEMIKNANDELLPEGEEWGFSDNTQGGPYGGPSLYESDEWINNINYNAGKYGKTIGALTGQGNGSLSNRKGTGSMGDINPNTGQPIIWTEGEVVQGAKLGEIVDTPAGRYMIVNGANGQLALKGLKGAAHGGGNYFFNMVNKGHHVGINPNTGDVWYQGAPELLAAAERSSAAGGDFWTALQGGPDDNGVWDAQRRENFHKYGSDGPQGGGNNLGGRGRPSGQSPTWGHMDDIAGGQPDRGPVWGSGLFSNETASMRRALVDNLEKKLLG